jgi:uncharacterized membrane protein
MIEIIPNWHPIFVHFTVALISTAGLFFILAKLLSNLKIGTELRISGQWTLWMAGLITIATVVAGFFAYYSVAHNPDSHIAMTIHRNWALATLLVLLICCVWSIIHYRNKTNPTSAFIVALLILLALVAVTAWRGGELVYRYGVGVDVIEKKAKNITHGHGRSNMQQEAGNHDTHDHN